MNAVRRGGEEGVGPGHDAQPRALCVNAGTEKEAKMSGVAVVEIEIGRGLGKAQRGGGRLSD